MRKSVYLILFALVFCMSNRVQAQIAMFGTNPQHAGFYDSDIPSDLLLTKKWKFKTDGMIFSSAIVANDVIYFGSDDSCLYALDTTGLLKWKFKSNGIIRSTPAVKDTVVYFNNYGGTFYAINTNTGIELWNFVTEGEMRFSQVGLFGWTPSNLLMDDPWDFYTSSPVITDTIIFFGSGKNVYALNNKTGNQIWKYVANDVVHSSPAVSNGTIFFGGWSGKFYALDAMTGSEKWTYSTGTDATHLMQGIQSSPSIIDTIVVFGARDAKVYALSTITGSKIWSTGFGGSWMPGSYAYYNETVFTGSSEGGGLKALNISNGSIKYTTSKNFYYTFSTPAITSETAFAGCMNGSLFAVDVNSGAIKCRFDTDGRISDPLNAILDNGTLNPSVFNPVSGYPYSEAVEYVRRLLTAGSIPSTPVIYNDAVYFGSSDSCFYAIYDDGSCKLKFQTSTGTINLGETSTVVIDTAFYIRNIGDCPDSVDVYVSGSPSALIESLNIQPGTFTILPNDSVKVSINLNTSNLTPDMNYLATIVSQSNKNEYNYLNTLFSLKTPAVSGMSKIEEEQSDCVYPNPFSEFTVLKYSLKQDCFVEIRIYNSSGQLVNILVSQNQEIGEHKVIWDGENGENTKVNPGLYLCSIIKGNSIITKRIIVLTK